MNSLSLTLDIRNDLGIPEIPPANIKKPETLFADFKSLPELVLTKDELDRYKQAALEQLRVGNGAAAGLNRSQTTGGENKPENEGDLMDVDQKDDEEDHLKWFQDINEFSKAVLREEFNLFLTLSDLTSVISDFLVNIESFLELVAKYGSLELSFTWSTVSNEVVELNNRPVFVRFHKISDFIRFITLYRRLDSAKFGKIQSDENIEKLYEEAEDKFESEVDLDQFEKWFKETEESSKNGSRRRNKQDTDIYNYKIDMKELVDVPKDLIDTVTNDIVEFRLRVLKIEKQKREREAINDKKKSRMKLKHLYQDISKSGKGGNGIFDEDEGGEEEDEELEEEGGEKILDDAEFEFRRQAKQKALEEERYATKLKIVRDQDKLRSALKENIDKLRDYKAQQIEPKRQKFLAEFVEGIRDGDNKIDLNLDKFYLKHQMYLKFRHQVKRKEEARDAQVKDILKYVEELMMEFVGIKDESLEEFILDACDANYPDKKPVVSALRETLDEDAGVFVDKLWLFIESDE